MHDHSTRTFRIQATALVLSVTISLALTSFCIAATPAKPATAKVDANSKDLDFTFPTEGTLAPDLVQTPLYKMHAALIEQSKKLYREKNYKALDELGNRLCNTRARYETGAWQIDSFFPGIANSIALDMPDGAFEQEIAKINDWTKQFPQSIIPRVAMINLLTCYAFKARGGEYADKVSNASWKLFNERLKKVDEVVQEAEKLPPTCPSLYVSELSLGPPENFDRTQMEKIFDKCQKNFPGYNGIYKPMYEYLQPHWHGRPGDSEQFVMDQVNKLSKGAASDEAYARVIWKLIDFTTPHGKLFTASALSWPKAKAGFEQLMKKYPGNLDILSIYAKAADYADDHSTAVQLFKKIGMRCDQAVFNKKDFLTARMHAFSGEQYPDMTQPTAAEGQQ